MLWDGRSCRTNHSPIVWNRTILRPLRGSIGRNARSEGYMLRASSRALMSNDSNCRLLSRDPGCLLESKVYETFQWAFLRDQLRLITVPCSHEQCKSTFTVTLFRTQLTISMIRVDRRDSNETERFPMNEVEFEVVAFCLYLTL